MKEDNWCLYKQHIHFGTDDEYFKGEDVDKFRKKIIEYIKLISKMSKDESTYKHVNPRMVIYIINQLFGGD